MNITQRRELIADMIEREREVSTAELKKKFNVSAVTLRYDLIHLERTGVCRRLFGKVVAADGEIGMRLNYNYEKNLDLKERIGRHAAGLINESESVLFYAGSTTQQVARFVDPQLRFIALTNSIFIAQELSKLPNARIIFIGGLFSREIGATYGTKTVEEIHEYNIDKLFLSVDGIDAECGITNSSPFETDVNRALLSHAKEVIVVADSSKVGTTSFMQMGAVSDVNMLITDSGADPGAVKALGDAGVKVTVV